MAYKYVFGAVVFMSTIQTSPRAVSHTEQGCVSRSLSSPCCRKHCCLRAEHPWHLAWQASGVPLGSSTATLPLPALSDSQPHNLLEQASPSTSSPLTPAPPDHPVGSMWSAFPHFGPFLCYAPQLKGPNMNLHLPIF